MTTNDRDLHHLLDAFRSAQIDLLISLDWTISDADHPQIHEHHQTRPFNVYWDAENAGWDFHIMIELRLDSGHKGDWAPLAARLSAHQNTTGRTLIDGNAHPAYAFLIGGRETLDDLADRLITVGADRADPRTYRGFDEYAFLDRRPYPVTPVLINWDDLGKHARATPPHLSIPTRRLTSRERHPLTGEETR
ncbi:hypothetical protein [Kocuria rosea]|uniref:hypothetical protein n=1 Tax=Kocuria rosea TaxID=1275 RepID=UPI000D647F39|nr:hypothetical protein [Kocuria rosea]PWF88686.1 hypothetical protein DEJ37_06250 [Kocuria rosea]STX02471.1 Uncharacterised protein [Kocuria rosea]